MPAPFAPGHHPPRHLTGSLGRGAGRRGRRKAIQRSERLRPGFVQISSSFGRRQACEATRETSDRQARKSRHPLAGPTEPNHGTACCLRSVGRCQISANSAGQTPDQRTIRAEHGGHAERDDSTLSGRPKQDRPGWYTDQLVRRTVRDWGSDHLGDLDGHRGGTVSHKGLDPLAAKPRSTHGIGGPSCRRIKQSPRPPPRRLQRYRNLVCQGGLPMRRPTDVRTGFRVKGNGCVFIWR